MSAGPEVLTLREVADRVERATGWRPGNRTVSRWIRLGVGGTKLRKRKVGGVVLVEPQWVDDFLRATNQPESQAS